MEDRTTTQLQIMSTNLIVYIFELYNYNFLNSFYSYKEYRTYISYIVYNNIDNRKTKNKI